MPTITGTGRAAFRLGQTLTSTGTDRTALQWWYTCTGGPLGHSACWYAMLPVLSSLQKDRQV